MAARMGHCCDLKVTLPSYKCDDHRNNEILHFENVEVLREVFVSITS